MKILLTGDIHNGYGDGQASLWAMKVMREYAHRNKIENIVVLGDLFDRRDHLAIDTISSVAEFFRVADEEYNQAWIIFPGNHDMFLRNSWDINSLQFLSTHINLVQSFSNFELDGQKFWVIPFIHHEDAYMQAVARINELATTNDILLTHIGVCGAIMNQCFLHKNWSVVNFSGTKFKFIFTGHFHNHQALESDKRVVYPGSPVAFRFDEGMVDHGFIVYDTITSTWEFINARDIAEEYKLDVPADFVTITDTDEYDSDELELIVKNNNVKFVQTRDYTQKELEELRDKFNYIGAKKLIWNKKQDEIDITSISIDQSDVNTKSMMELYLDHESTPSYISREFLTKLDETICKEADERLSKEETYDAD